MAQYIEKSALVAEIERIDKSIGCDRFLSEYEKGCNQGKEDVCDTLRNFLDTLEVKGADLENEIDKELDEEWYGEYINLEKFKRTAKHFFELGLKAQSKDIIEALRTEYEKGRADVIANTLSWLENCWPKYCSNQTIIEGFKETMKE